MLNPRDVKTITDAKQIIEERKLTHVKVGVFSLDGVLLGKYMAKDAFICALEHGFSICNVVLGWDLKDHHYDNIEYTGWHTGYPDATVRIIPSSCRDLCFEDTLLFLGEFTGTAAAFCPRAVLHRVLDKAEQMGFEAFAALEYEFFIFDETPHSVREKGYRNLKSLTPDNFGYSIIRNTVHSELYHQILEMGERMDFPIEGLHTESGPGVFEAAIRYDTAEAAGDKAALFKTFMKILAQRTNKMATFMAKWSNKYPGQSGHIHLSLRTRNNGQSAFFDKEQPHCMSTIQRQFLAGQQQLMPEFLALFSPTINSYSRLVPGSCAPTHATWGVENRTTALRLIKGNAETQRIEYRLGSADANPYFALAAAIGSGLYGIEHELEPDSEIKGNSYTQTHNLERALPSTLWDAAQNFKKSQAAHDLFGSEFVAHYAASREWEEREFRKHITDWELERYFEII